MTSNSELPFFMLLPDVSILDVVAFKAHELTIGGFSKL